MTLAPDHAGGPEPRISDIDLAGLIHAEPEAIQELIVQTRDCIAKLGRVEVDGGSYRLNRLQCLYVMDVSNTSLSQEVAAGVEEAFADSDRQRISIGRLAEIFGLDDVRAFRRLSYGLLGRDENDIKPHLLGRRQCHFLVEMFSRALIAANAAEVDAHFDYLGDAPFEPDLPPSPTLH